MGWQKVCLRSGHGSFSNNRTLNDLVGNIAHSSILVPYHGWRISHRTHHQNHGHVENDESWHPVSKHLYDKMVRSPFRHSFQQKQFANLFLGTWGPNKVFTDTFFNTSKAGSISSITRIPQWIWLKTNFDLRSSCISVQARLLVCNVQFLWFEKSWKCVWKEG